MKKLTKTDASRLMKSITTFFFDCDGVLWNSLGLIPMAQELINKLQSMEKQVFFVTNNNLKSRQALLKKFTDYGFDVKAEQVLSTSYLAAAYIKNIVKLDEQKKVYMIGSIGLCDEFDLLGIKHIGFGPRLPNSEKDTFAKLNHTKEADVGAVVIGYDEHLNLNKICEAMQYLLDPSMPFIATNMDNRYPVGKGVLSIGTGVCVQAVIAAAERQPIVLGKPNKMFLDIAQTTNDIDPTKSLMIGDRLNTDITFGRNCGFETLCVLTGVTSESKLEEVTKNGDTNLIPDYFSESLEELFSGI